MTLKITPKLFAHQKTKQKNTNQNKTKQKITLKNIDKENHTHTEIFFFVVQGHYTENF